MKWSDESRLRRGMRTANAAFARRRGAGGRLPLSRAFQMMVEVDDMRVMRVLRMPQHHRRRAK